MAEVVGIDVVSDLVCVFRVTTYDDQRHIVWQIGQGLDCQQDVLSSLDGADAPSG